jgi:hypothetical protein
MPCPSNFTLGEEKQKKKAAYRLYLQQIHSLSLTQENKEQEITIIKQTANSNRFSNNMIEKLNYKILHKAPTLQTTQNNLNTKWIKFTHLFL